MIYIFNPDTEMALAAARPSYTPPASIRLRMERLALLPALYAPERSCIVADNPGASSPLLATEAQKRGMRVIPTAAVRDTVGEIRPWGWNLPLAAGLARLGVDSGRIPSAARLHDLRELAHRRTASQFNVLLGRPPAAEYSDTESALKAIAGLRGAVVKSPWSSSGRGVIFTRLTPAGRLRDAVAGIIRRQGSVMIEPELAGVRDFATEWECAGGKARYVGFSAFSTGASGGYDGNIVDSESALRELCPQFTDEVLEAQRSALEQIVAPKYSGPLGIDMLVDEEGELHPCIEINLRTTMGHVAAEVWRRTGSTSVLNAWSL